MLLRKMEENCMEEIRVITKDAVVEPVPRGVICGVGCASGFFCF